MSTDYEPHDLVERDERPRDARGAVVTREPQDARTQAFRWLLGQPLGRRALIELRRHRPDTVYRAHGGEMARVAGVADVFQALDEDLRTSDFAGFQLMEQEERVLAGKRKSP